MKRTQWLFACLAVAGLGLGGCGDDDDTVPVDGGGETDAGMDGGETPEGCPPPTAAPNCGDMGGQMGACCYRASNATRQDAPEYRMAQLRLSEPRSLSNAIILNILNQAIEEERFNWLIRVTGADADGAVTITTGFGRGNADGTFTFADGDAPGPEDPNRWDPQMLEGTLTGETVTTGSLNEVFAVPVLNTDGTEVILELPLRGFRVIGATMSEERSCIGNRSGNAYCSRDGTVETFIAVEDADGIVNQPPVVARLCWLLSGDLGAGEVECASRPRSEWTIPPNALCDGGNCTTGACDPLTDCNAWRVVGGFSAHGVNITE
ncbi:MAG: hypothetical protein KF901_25045 [Myxococcales bacterium]|nr:hypothetical protein [Myxococcales bacterium]